MNETLVARFVLTLFGASILSGFFVPSISLGILLVAAAACVAIVFSVQGALRRFALLRLRDVAIFLVANIIVAFLPESIKKPFGDILLMGYAMSLWHAWLMVQRYEQKTNADVRHG